MKLSNFGKTEVIGGRHLGIWKSKMHGFVQKIYQQKSKEGPRGRNLKIYKQRKC